MNNHEEKFEEIRQKLIHAKTDREAKALDDLIQS